MATLWIARSSRAEAEQSRLSRGPRLSECEAVRGESVSSASPWIYFVPKELIRDGKTTLDSVICRLSEIPSVWRLGAGEARFLCGVRAVLGLSRVISQATIYPAATLPGEHLLVLQVCCSLFNLLQGQHGGRGGTAGPTPYLAMSASKSPGEGDEGFRLLEGRGSSPAFLLSVAFIPLRFISSTSPCLSLLNNNTRKSVGLSHPYSSFGEERAFWRITGG